MRRAVKQVQKQAQKTDKLHRSKISEGLSVIRAETGVTGAMRAPQALLNNASVLSVAKRNGYFKISSTLPNIIEAQGTKVGFYEF